MEPFGLLRFLQSALFPREPSPSLSQPAQEKESDPRPVRPSDSAANLPPPDPTENNRFVELMERHERAVKNIRKKNG